MPVELIITDKIGIVLIVGDNYNTCREAAEIFNAFKFVSLILDIQVMQSIL